MDGMNRMLNSGTDDDKLHKHIIKFSQFTLTNVANAGGTKAPSLHIN